MSLIQIELTPEEAHNALVIIDLAFKHKNGGVKIAKPAMELVDKIQAAVANAQSLQNATPTSAADK